MTPTSPIPTYPESPSDLIAMLCDREADRLLGPVVQQAVANDTTDTEHLRQVTALTRLRAAKAWAEMNSGRFIAIEAVYTNQSVETCCAGEGE